MIPIHLKIWLLRNREEFSLFVIFYIIFSDYLIIINSTVLLRRSLVCHVFPGISPHLHFLWTSEEFLRRARKELIVNSPNEACFLPPNILYLGRSFWKKLFFCKTESGVFSLFLLVIFFGNIWSGEEPILVGSFDHNWGVITNFTPLARCVFSLIVFTDPDRFPVHGYGLKFTQIYHFCVREI